MHNTSLWEGGTELEGQGKIYVAFQRVSKLEGWMRGVGSDGPAWCGDVLPSRVCVRAAWASVGDPACSGQDWRWICDGELTPRQLAANGAA